MTCLKCGSDATRVLRTGRKYSDLGGHEYVKRNRGCKACGFRWVTLEVPVDAMKEWKAAIEEALDE